MNVRKILVPIDFSPVTKRVMQYATALARDSGASLLITFVEEPPIPYGSGELYAGGVEPSAADWSTMLEEVVPTDESVSHEHRLIMGDPSHEIVQLASEEGADLIVMGTHGRTGLSRLLMGSVAEAVVRRANCPVFTLKEPTESEPAS